jgi:hypothetical protein
VISNSCAPDSSRTTDVTPTTSSLYLPIGSLTFKISFSNPKFCHSKSQRWQQVQMSNSLIALPALVASFILRPLRHLRRDLVLQNNRRTCSTSTLSRLKTTQWRQATCSRLKWTALLIILAVLDVSTRKCSTLLKIHWDQQIFQTCMRIFCSLELHSHTRYRSQNFRMLKAATKSSDLGTTARFLLQIKLRP